MRIPLSVSLLLSSSVLLGPAPPVQTVAELFPIPAGGLTIPAREPDGWNMEELLLEYGRLTDQQFMINDDVKSILRMARVSLTDELTVAPEAVHSVVETLLIQSDFVLTILRESDPRLVSVGSVASVGRGGVRQNARLVPVDELAQWRDHPAHLLNTVIALDHVDVRILSNTMRAVLTDANTQQILPVGNTNTVLLAGFGPQLETFARIFIQADENERLRYEKVPKATEGVER